MRNSIFIKGKSVGFPAGKMADLRQCKAGLRHRVLRCGVQFRI